MLFTALITLVVITTYGFQLDLPEALNRLTDHSAVTRKLRFHQSGICPDRGSSLVEKDGPFVWDAAKHRLFLWSFHLGYMASGVPGAIVAEKYSAKWAIVFSLSLMLIASMFIPIVVLFKESVQPDVFAFLMLLEGLGGYLALRIVPYLAMFFVSITAGLTIDVARHHGVISTTGGRRYASLVAVLFPAIALISMTFIECSTSIASGVYLIGICTLGAQSVGWLTNHLDLAPNFAGPLMAITNSVATVPYLLWPFLVATITEGSGGTELRDRWSMTFQGVAGLHFLSFIFYALSGTGVIQDWNMYKG